MTWANQVRILKQQFEALGSVIGRSAINFFKPFVQAANNAMSKIIVFAETVGNALGAIFGWEIEISDGGATNDIAEDAEDFASGLGDANKKAKELKNTLLSIDQIHALNGDSGSGSGSSGTGSDGGASGNGSSANLVKVDSILEKYKSEISTLEGVGNYIRDTIIDSLTNIDWDKEKDKAKGFATGLANFLNGFFAPNKDGKTVFGAVGTTVAEALNTAIITAFTFSDTLHWEDIGQNIADGINNFFTTFDFKMLAQTTNSWVDGIKTMIATALNEIKWSDVAIGLLDFAASLELDTITILVGAGALKWALKSGAAGTALKSLVSLIKGLLVSESSTALLGVELTTAGIALTLTAGIAIAGVLSWAYIKMDARDFDSALDDALKSGKITQDEYDALNGKNALKKAQMMYQLSIGIDWADIDTSTIAGNVKEWWGKLKSFVETKIKENFTKDGIKLQFKDLFKDGIFGKDSQLSEEYKIDIKVIPNWIKGKFTSLKEWFKTNIGDSSDAEVNVKAKFSGWAKNPMEKLGIKTVDVKARLKSWADKWNNLPSKIFDLKARLFQWAKNWNGLGTKTIDVKAKITDLVGTVGGKLKGLLGITGKADGGVLVNGKWRDIRGYASGGQPLSAEVFMARENGIPEMVGRIGNRTTVANNDQIVASIESGVFNAVVSAMSSIRGNNSTGTVEIPIYIGEQEVYRAVMNQQKLRNRGYNFEPRFV